MCNTQLAFSHTFGQRAYFAMNDVTQILVAMEKGEPAAAEQLLPLVYEELRNLAVQKMAHERPGQTLQATALVHEAYLRLVGSRNAQRWDSRGHFFAAAAEAMRRILVENARRKGRIKRGGARRRIDLESTDWVSSTVSDNLLDLDDALKSAIRRRSRRGRTHQAAPVCRPVDRRGRQIVGNFALNCL